MRLCNGISTELEHGRANCFNTMNRLTTGINPLAVIERKIFFLFYLEIHSTGVIIFLSVSEMLPSVPIFPEIL